MQTPGLPGVEEHLVVGGVTVVDGDGAQIPDFTGVEQEVETLVRDSFDGDFEGVHA